METETCQPGLFSGQQNFEDQFICPIINITISWNLIGSEAADFAELNDYSNCLAVITQLRKLINSLQQPIFSLGLIWSEIMLIITN